MANLINSGFLAGFLLARGLPRDEQIHVALTAGAIPADRMLLPIFSLKRLVDRQAALERAVDARPTNVGPKRPRGAADDDGEATEDAPRKRTGRKAAKRGAGKRGPRKRP